MKTIIVASVKRSAGKTSAIAGLTKSLNKRIGYMKPLGDRLLYRKKRLWDHDSAVITSQFKLEENPEEMSIGFEHAKLRYMHDEAGIKKKLKEMADHNSKGKDMLFVEGPQDLSFGTSIFLDAISVAKGLGGELLLVLSGSADEIIDDAIFADKIIKFASVQCIGAIINKVHDVEDFKDSYLPLLKNSINVLGVVPYKDELATFTVGHVSDALFARVISGEAGLNRTIKRVFVGAMTADTVLKDHVFKKEQKKLVITSGDRSDMIAAALETDTSAIVITNNILPSPTLISKAAMMNVPLLLVPSDTFQVAKQIDDMEPLLSRDDIEKVALLGKLYKEDISFKTLA